ncbi:MAG: ABC transporter substrate-binding protein [Curvibacter sp.]|nr:ABC transporter substrate-binding protein [Curvibacter sp.]
MRFRLPLAAWLCSASLLLSCCLPVAHAAEDLVVAQIGPFTGLPSPDAPDIHAGAKAYFDQVNKSGGINGRRITLFTLDDRFTADGFKAALPKALEAKPVALLSPVGSAALSAALQDKLFDNANLVVINAVPGADTLRSPGHPRLFHVRASDRDQYGRMLAHGRTLGVTSVHVLYQQLPIGQQGMAAVRDLAPGYGYTEVAGTESRHEDAALAEAAKAAEAGHPQSVIVIGSPKFMADAVKQLRAAGYNRSIMALSYLSAPLLVQVAGEAAARGVGIAQTFPNPNGRGLPLQAEFQATMARYAPEIKAYSAFQLEGYLSARVLVDALRRARNSSPEALMDALHSAGELDYGGFRVNFSKSNVGSSWVDMSVIDAAGKLRY